MAKEKELPKHIQEFYDKDKKVRKLLDTTHAVHSEAYQKAMDTIRDDKGQIDYEKLEDVKIQDGFLDKMMDHYLSSAVKSLGLKEKPKEEFEQDILLQNYVGVTRGELKRILRSDKSEYTLKRHEGIRDKLIEKQTGRLLPLRSAHLENKHIEDILKHTGVQDYIAKDRIHIEHAAGLLDLYKGKGQITLSDLQHLTNTQEEKGGWGNTVYLTDKAKEEIKAFKDRYKKAA